MCLAVQRSTLAAALALALLGTSGGAATAAVVQRGALRVGVDAGISPRKLPRVGAAPVSVAIGLHVATTDSSLLPQLRHLRIEVNRAGRLETAGLPTCRYRQIQPATSDQALAACGPALVGRGHLTADVVLPYLAPLPSSGQVLAFNARYRGHRAILAHVFGTHPFPTSYTLAFAISRGRGRFGTALTAPLSRAVKDWGFLTSLSLKLGRTYRYRGATRSYLSAGCPAPAGFPTAAFPVARASLGFAGEPPLSSTVNGQCWVRR